MNKLNLNNPAIITIMTRDVENATGTIHIMTTAITPRLFALAIKTKSNPLFDDISITH